MNNIIIAKRYAEGFLEFAKPSLGIEKIVEEFKNVKLILSGNPDFKEFLENYDILHDEKYAVLDKVLKAFSQEIRDLFKLLIVKDHAKIMTDICDYVRMTYAHGEAVDALLRTTYPLDLSLIEAIKEQAERKLNKKLSLHIEFDASLLGGVQLTVGNLIIDGSVRKRLDQLKDKLQALRV